MSEQSEKCEECGSEAYGYIDILGTPLCAIHLATYRSFEQGEYSEAQTKEYRARMEQAIIDEVHSRVRGD